MQTAKNAAEKVKESAANVAASAKSGMEKTKATVQEKGERMTAHDPMQKEMATEKKHDKINQAEINKQVARENNAAAAQSHSATGQPAGMHQMPAMPGHGTGQPAGQVTDGVVGSHPIGTTTGTETTNAGLGGGTNTGYGAGGVHR